MQAAPARYVSVSELYTTDEVELLLDEIRELEPTSCRGEDVQDFEIAGSGCGAWGAAGGGAGAGAGGGRSPAGTEATERSWDSHAQYRREPPRPPQSLAPLYCRPRYLFTVQGLATLLVTLSCACASGCVWGAAGLRLGAAGGAGAAGARALQLGALSSTLLHGALLAMRLTDLHLLMSLDWDALSAACCVWSLCWLSGGAGGLLPALVARDARDPAPHVLTLLYTAVGLSLSACAACLAALAWWGVGRWRGAAARGRYRAVPSAPPAGAPDASAADPVPSTSRAAL